MFWCRKSVGTDEILSPLRCMFCNPKFVILCLKFGLWNVCRVICVNSCVNICVNGDLCEYWGYFYWVIGLSVFPVMPVILLCFVLCVSVFCLLCLLWFYVVLRYLCLIVFNFGLIVSDCVCFDCVCSSGAAFFLSPGIERWLSLVPPKKYFLGGCHGMFRQIIAL